MGIVRGGRHKGLLDERSGSDGRKGLEINKPGAARRRTPGRKTRLQGEGVLADIVRDLVKSVRKSVIVEWMSRDDVRAELRSRSSGC